MQPVIGITTYQEKKANGLAYVMIYQAYADAVLQAGGAPVLIPSMLSEQGWESVYERLDGILLAGGGDIGLEHFNGDEHVRIDGVDPMRDTLELNFFKAAVADDKPFFGICRGIQLVNVGLGGTLYTHVPDQHPEAIDHTYPGNMRTVLAHEVRIEEGSRMAGIVAEQILQVNSLHHQGLNEVASELRVCGSAPDGLVEAVELPGHTFGLAVQWHPEWLTDQKPTRNLFKAFIEAAGKHQT